MLLGVQKIMVTGTSIKTSKEALRLTRIYPGKEKTRALINKN